MNPVALIDGGKVWGWKCMKCGGIHNTRQAAMDCCTKKEANHVTEEGRGQSD